MIAKGFDDGLSGWFGLAARHDGDLRMTTWFPVRAGLRDERGAVRLGALVFSIDSAVGITAGLASLPDWVVTTDIHLQLFGGVTVGPVRCEAVPVRRGRSQVLVEARLYDGEGAAPIAAATANHTSLTPEAGPPMDLLPVGEVFHSPAPRVESGVPADLDTYFGVSVSEPGRAEVGMGPRSRNPWGILHGAVHTLLVERAVGSLVPGTVEDLMLRFVAPVRVGPAVAVAKVVGGGEHRQVVRVEVRDEGADRLGCVATVSLSAGGRTQPSVISTP